MNLIKPNKIKKGDTIAIIAPSGCIKKEKVINAKEYFESQGYKVKLGENIFKQDRYMAGTDIERAQDINNAFKNPEVNAILCARGGYGALRILDKIDYDSVKRNPKIFCGYSDISAISAMILKKCGLITFSGPMAKGDFQPKNLDKYTIEKFWETINNEKIEIKPIVEKIYNPGDAKGILFGGNLATIASLCGTNFIPDTEFIFFAEDLNEPVYKIDKYFTQLFSIDDFKNNIQAIIIGDFLEINDDTALSELFTELGEKYRIPIIGRYPISHSKTKATIPYGGKAILENSILNISSYSI